MFSRHFAREDASVVAVPVHSAGVAWHAVLAQTRRRLVDRAAEIHARDRRALPERGLRRKLVAADGRDAELWQIQRWAREPSRRDNVVDLEQELGSAVGLSCVHEERRSRALDTLDRRVEHDDAAGEDVVLVGLNVPGAYSDERPRVDRKLCRRRGREDDLPGPLQEPRRELEAGILFADDEHAAPGVGLGRTRLGVMRRVLNAWYLRTPWLSHADGEDRDPAAILAVARLENPAIAIATRPSPPASVAHLEPGPLGERSEISLHLRPRRVIGG